MRRPGLALGAVAFLAAAGCSTSPGLHLDHVAGTGGSATSVFLDTQVAPYVTATFPALLGRRSAAVRWGVGSPAAIVATIKDGGRVDAVVLPRGADLTQVSDELVAPAEPIGTVGPTTYYAGAVDAQGLSFVTFLTRAGGRRALAAHGLHPPPVR